MLSVVVPHTTVKVAGIYERVSLIHCRITDRRKKFYSAGF
jgi:hypothetical protein